MTELFDSEYVHKHFEAHESKNDKAGETVVDNQYVNGEPEVSRWFSFSI